MNRDEILNELMVSHRNAEVYKNEHSTNRFPQDFKLMVQKAIKSGVRQADIHRATGISLVTIQSWLKKKLKNDKPELVPLEIVGERPSNEVVITFPSGITVRIPPMSLNHSLFEWMMKVS